MHKHLCWIGRGTHIRGTQHDNKRQHGHTQQDINGTVITCVHTCHLWDSHVFTLFVCGMQRIHKHKKVGFALTESLPSKELTHHFPIPHPLGSRTRTEVKVAVGPPSSTVLPGNSGLPLHRLRTTKACVLGLVDPLMVGSKHAPSFGVALPWALFDWEEVMTLD